MNVDDNIKTSAVKKDKESMKMENKMWLRH